MTIPKMYHGTVDVYWHQILKEGLRPNLQNSWRIRFESGNKLRDFEEVDSIFLTPLPEMARLFAISKANYLRAKPGEHFLFGDNPFMTKTEDAPVIKDAKPIVLELAIPDSALGLIEIDPLAYYSYKIHTSLAPSAILRAVSEKGLIL
jgi:hypothetical protein